MMFLRIALQVGVVLSLVLAVSAAPITASAAEDEPSKRQKIIDLMKTINIVATIDSTVPQVTGAMVQAVRQSGEDVPPEMETVISNAVSKVMKANMRPYLRAVVNLYDVSYTEGEIDDLVAFYKTPTGQKTLQMQPELAGKMTQIAARWSQSLLPELKTELEQKLAEQRFPEPVK